MATAVAAVVARVAPRAADRAAAARAVLALRRQGCSGSSGSSDGDGTSLSTASSTALTRVLARAFGGVDSGGVRAISENSTGPHTVDVGAPPDWAAPGLMRRRVRVGGCSEAWRELGMRLDTKPAPWLEDNGSWLVSGCRWFGRRLCAPSGAHHTSIGAGQKCSPLRHRSQRHVRYARLASGCRVPRSGDVGQRLQRRPRTNRSLSKLSGGVHAISWRGHHAGFYDIIHPPHLRWAFNLTELN